MNSLLKTSLSDRELWFDGVSSFDANNISELLQKYNVSAVDRLTPEISEYNKHVKKSEEIVVKQDCELPIPNWVLPDKYDKLELESWIFQKHDQLAQTNNWTVTEITSRLNRLCTELVEFENRNLTNLLKTMVYITDQLTQKQILWGVGRGSSVSSYLLYVLGVHDVDSFAFDLDIEDFMHE